MSPKIQAFLALPGTDPVRSRLSTLAMTDTGTADVDSPLAALKADSSKLAAFEDRVVSLGTAANPASDGSPVASQVTVRAIPAPTAGTGGTGSAAPPLSTPSDGSVGRPPVLPPRGNMWVAPAVSGAVIAGFFVMLWMLVSCEYSPSTKASSSSASQVQSIQPQETPSAPNASGANTQQTSTAAVNAPKPVVSTNPPAGNSPAGNPPAVSTPNTNQTAANVQSNPPQPGSGGLQNVLFTLLGAVGAAFTQVVNYWLGSSKGSSDKTDFMAVSPPVQIQNLGVTEHSTPGTGK